VRIAVYKDNLSTGRGADGAVKNFAAGMAERGHTVALMEKAEFFARILHPVKSAADDAANKFDVIVATGSNEIVDIDSSGYFSRPGRAKVVLQLHLAPRGFFKWKHPFRNRRIRVAFDKPDAVQVLCSSYEDEFRRIAPHPRLCTIGNYTTISATPPDRESPICDSPARTILYPAAAVNRIKNQKLVIEAFTLLAKDFPAWNVRLLGKDTTSYAAECRRLIAKKGLAGRIVLAGFTDDLRSEYSRASFVAFPSTLEGFPLAILEAARFALPAVVQSGLPGVADIVQDGQTGLVAAPSTRSYAEGLRRLMSDGELRRSLGENARIYCESRYSRERVLDEWEYLLSVILTLSVARDL